MTAATPTPADIRAALEDLRTADRILLGVQGTTAFLRKQQLLDLIGAPTGEGLFGGETVRDNRHANDELLVAQQAMTDAMRRLGIAPDAPEELRVWGRLDAIIDHEWLDFLALGTARVNHDTASRVRARVRALFERVCQQHPEGAAGVPPLADADIVGDERPPSDWLKVVVGAALVAALALIALLS